MTVESIVTVEKYCDYRDCCDSRDYRHCDSRDYCDSVDSGDS